MIEAELPDGTILEFPEGTAPDIVQKAVKSRLGVSEPAQAAPSFVQMLKREILGSVPVQAGMGAIRGAGSIGSTLIRPFESAAENEQRRQAITGGLEQLGAQPESLSFQAGKIGGEIAGTAGIPGVLAKGAQAARFAAPMVEALRTGGMAAGGLRGIPGALTRVAGGATTGGAVAGAVNPEDAGTGAMLGGVLPMATQAALATGRKIGSVAKSFAEPFYESGRSQIMGRALRNVAGNQADEAIRNLRNARSVVPGSMPTAAEAAQNPGIAAMQRTATAIDPVAMNQAAARQAANNAARVEALEQMAGTSADRAALAEFRAGTAEDLYKQAYGKTIDLSRDAVTGKFLSKAEQAGRKAEITKLMRTPAMKEAAKRAQKLMLNDPNKFGKASSAMGSVEGLDYTRRALGDMIKEASPNEQRVLIGLRDRLDTTLQSISPKYLEAKNTFAAMSKPISEMDVAQEIANKSVNRLTGAIQPSAYARALQDQTAATATGMKKATLEGTMQPKNLAILNALREDLARQNFAQTAGRGVGSDTVQKLAFTNILDQAGIPQFIRSFGPAGALGNIAQRAGQVAYKDANERMAAELAQSLLNPQSAASLMEAAAAKPRNIALESALKRAALTAPVISAQ